MRCICLPRCLGGGVHEEGEGDSKKDIMNDNRPHIHRKLNQYFTNDVGSAHIPHHHQKTLTQQFTPSNPNPANANLPWLVAHSSLGDNTQTKGKSPKYQSLPFSSVSSLPNRRFSSRS